MKLKNQIPQRIKKKPSNKRKKKVNSLRTIKINEILNKNYQKKKKEL